MQHWRILDALDRPATALGVLPEWATLKPQLTLHLYDMLPSTNQMAWQLIQQGQGAGTVVIAAQQTAGRGQWGRTWLSAPGGLYLSLVLEPTLAIAEASLLPLASAWGIATSLVNLGVPIQVKWPNDLVSRGRKVGGILVESRLPGKLPQVVIGVGINWDNSPPANGISLRQLLPDDPMPPVKDLESLAAIVLRGVLQGYYCWQQQGPQALIAAYQANLWHLGKNVSVNGHSGRVCGVSTQGHLAIEVHQSGQKTIQYLKPGEISLGYNA